MSVDSVPVEIADRYRELFAMSREARVAEFARLREEDPMFLAAMSTYIRTCDYRDDISGERCGDTTFEDLQVCIRHIRYAPVRATQDSLASRRLAAAAKLTAMTEKAVDELDRLLTDPMARGELKAKVAAEILDRGGLPRHTASSVEARIDTTVTIEDPAREVKARLDRLAASATEAALRGISTASNQDEIADAHVIDDDDDGTAA